MTRDEAKFILSAYRADSSDREDPVFAEALALARTDPELAEWFSREQRHDLAVAHRLREVPAPAGLRAAIVAGVRAGGGAVPRVGRVAGWSAAAVAACIAIVLAARVSLTPERSQPPLRPALVGLETLIINDTLVANGAHPGEWWNPTTKQLAHFLQKPTRKLGGSLPIAFEELRASGARTMNFSGHDIVEVCFARDGCWYHLYILKREDFPKLDNKPERDFREEVGFARWCDENFHYLVTGAGDREIQKHLF